MAQYSFGSGVMFGRSSVNSTPTPVKFGGLQGASLDFSFTTKQLYGSYQFPIAIARGTGKMTGKASWAQLNAQNYNDLFFGYSTNPSTGSVRMALDEAQTVTANIVTATNNSTYLADLGVFLASDGSPFIRVANTPIGQQYSCNESSGVYTFNASQNAVAVKINYKHTDASNGKKITITNQLLGNSPQFSMALGTTFTRLGVTKKATLILDNCMSSKLTFATKLEDFTIPDFEWEAYADDAGNIGTMSFDE